MIKLVKVVQKSTDDDNYQAVNESLVPDGRKRRYQGGFLGGVNA